MARLHTCYNDRMKTLLILRHAKSSWKDLTVTDHDRPLNKRGKRDAPRMGRWLRMHDLRPDLIVSSTARRAFTTAVAVADEVGYSQPVTATRDFYHADPSEYIEYLKGVSAEAPCIMVVGHNPGMEELIAQLGGGYEVMPTGTVAYFSLPIASWSEINDTTTGTLKAVWRPKEIEI